MHIISGDVSLACFLLVIRHMTHTEFIVREKSGGHHPLFKNAEIRIHIVDAAIILGFLTTFVGLVLLLSK
jgi:hypothetical protein